MTSGLPRYYAEVVDPILSMSGMSFSQIRGPGGRGRRPEAQTRVLAAIVWALRQRSIINPADGRFSTFAVGAVIGRCEDQVRHLYEGHALRLHEIEMAYDQAYGARYR